MNHKHVALLIVGLLGLLFVQVTLEIRKARDRMVSQADNKAAEEAAQESSLSIERNQLRTLQESSGDLIAFLDAWQPYFQRFSNAQSIQTELSLRVRNGDLVSLAQRFEEVPLKPDSALPQAMRAYATFEDNYASLLNWLGAIEKEIPTIRVSNLKLSRGNRPGDVRMEVTVEQPFLKE
jgi:hypothetical protein